MRGATQNQFWYATDFLTTVQYIPAIIIVCAGIPEAAGFGPQLFCTPEFFGGKYYTNMQGRGAIL